MLSAIKVNRILLSAQDMFLNFNANSLNSATNSSEKITVIANSTYPFEIIFATRLSCAITKGKALINNAFAGVGRPIKESDCRVSILNFASLNAEHAAMVKAIQGNKESANAPFKR